MSKRADTIRTKIAAGQWHAGKGTPWSADEIALLGTAPDPVIAARIGRARQNVTTKRNALGIPPAVKRGRPSGEKG